MDEELNVTEEIMPEESIESKINGHQAMANQYARMIEENERQIGLGDDVEARRNFIGVLRNAIAEENAKIEELKAQQ